MDFSSGHPLNVAVSQGSILSSLLTLCVLLKYFSLSPDFFFFSICNTDYSRIYLPAVSPKLQTFISECLTGTSKTEI